MNGKKLNLEFFVFNLKMHAKDFILVQTDISIETIVIEKLKKERKKRVKSIIDHKTRKESMMEKNRK